LEARTPSPSKVLVNPESKFVIRKAVEDDLPGILHCLRTAFEPYRTQYTPEAFQDTVLSVETLATRFRSMAIVVAEQADGKIAGTIGYRLVSPAHGHIRGMAVLPECRGIGVAQNLLDAVQDELRAQGCERVTLNTTKPLERAIAFYRKNGFQPTGATRDFFGMALYEYERRL